MSFFAESIARTVDRWYARTSTYAYSRRSSAHERFGYNGVPWLLGRALPHLAGQTERRRRLGVLMSQLSLLSGAPDQSFRHMLDYLRVQKPIPPIGQAAILLRDLLVHDGLLDFGAFNKEILGFQNTRAGHLMVDRERRAVLDHLTCVFNGATRTQTEPDWLASPRVTWDIVADWMRAYSVPAVLASDAPSGVKTVAQEPCSPTLYRMLKNLGSVMGT